MRKKRGSSWFAVVRKAFCNAKSGSKRQESEQQDEYKKRNANQTEYHHNQEKVVHMSMNKGAVTVDAADRAQALAVAAAEADFTRGFHNAAVVIQTAFRGYLARRALLALKGIVKLQASIRGHNVRKQAKLTLRCMQALVRLQWQMREQQARLSHERCRKSMFAESNSLWDRQRKSTSAGRNSGTDEWDFFHEDDEAAFGSRNNASLKREKALAYALSQQLWRFDSNRTEWLNRWMATKKRDSADREDSIRAVQVDTVVASQLIKARHSLSHPPTSTPSSCRTKLVQVRSAGPRCLDEERGQSTANTPSSGSKYSCSSGSGAATAAATPHYMTSTESAKAKARSVSTPGRERLRKRLSYPVPEQHVSDYTDNGSLSQCLRSTSFKSDCPALDRGA